MVTSLVSASLKARRGGWLQEIQVSTWCSRTSTIRLPPRPSGRERIGSRLSDVPAVRRSGCRTFQLSDDDDAGGGGAGGQCDRRQRRKAGAVDVEDADLVGLALVDPEG